MSELINPDRLIVVIRASGERTKDLCKKIVKEQIGGSELHEVEIVPFKKALEKTFELAIKSSKKWLLTVDADMLLTKNAVKVLLSEAEKMPNYYIQLQGRIIDKITGLERKAGPRVYRIELLEKLLKLSQAQPEHIRPENSIISKIGMAGHPSRYIHYITSLHDFGQYFKDIYRKAYTHGHKHTELLPQILKSCIDLKEKNDPDYKLILKAVYDSLTESMEVNIDTTIFDKKSEEACEALGFREKNKLSNGEHKKIDQLTALYSKGGSSDQYIHFYDKPEPEKNVFMLQKLKHAGFIRSVKNRIGAIFIKLGKKIKS